MVSDAYSFACPVIARTHPRAQDLIFKNQAMNSRKNEGGQFVNDLLRTEFHKCVHTFKTYPV